MLSEIQVLTEKDIRDARYRVRKVADKLAAQFHPTFTKNEWTWAWPNNGIPTQQDIEITIECLVNDLSSGTQISSVSTGRIWITAIKSQHDFSVHVEVFLSQNRAHV